MSSYIFPLSHSFFSIVRQVESRPQALLGMGGGSATAVKNFKRCRRQRSKWWNVWRQFQQTTQKVVILLFRVMMDSVDDFTSIHLKSKCVRFLMHANSLEKCCQLGNGYWAVKQMEFPARQTSLVWVLWTTKTPNQSGFRYSSQHSQSAAPRYRKHRGQPIRIGVTLIPQPIRFQVREPGQAVLAQVTQPSSQSQFKVNSQHSPTNVGYSSFRSRISG